MTWDTAFLLLASIIPEILRKSEFPGARQPSFWRIRYVDNLRYPKRLFREKDPFSSQKPTIPGERNPVIPRRRYLFLAPVDKLPAAFWGLRKREGNFLPFAQKSKKMCIRDRIGGSGGTYSLFFLFLLSLFLCSDYVIAPFVSTVNGRVLIFWNFFLAHSCNLKNTE